MTVERIECFGSPVASEVFHLFDPNCKFERRDAAHRGQAWTMSAQRKLETFIKVARLVAVALESVEKLQSVFDECLIHADFRGSGFVIRMGGLLFGACQMGRCVIDDETQLFPRITLRFDRVALFLDDHLERGRRSEWGWLWLWVLCVDRRHKRKPTQNHKIPKPTFCLFCAFSWHRFRASSSRPLPTESDGEALAIAV